MTASDGQEPVSIDKISNEVHYDDTNSNLALTKTDDEGSRNVSDNQFTENTENENIESNHVNAKAIDLDCDMFTDRTTSNELVVPSMTMSNNGECSEYDQINVEPVQLELELNTPTPEDNTSVTIGQIQYVLMAHSGRDGCFVCTVHSRWIRVALATSCRCGSSRQDWWRTLRWHEKVLSLSRVLQESSRINILL